MDRLGARPPTPPPQFYVLNHQSKRNEHPDGYTATWEKSRWTHLVQSRRRPSREWNGSMAARSPLAVSANLGTIMAWPSGFTQGTLCISDLRTLTTRT